jgi:LuxR family quorum-sensing system transcriptional regulator CciR
MFSGIDFKNFIMRFEQAADEELLCAVLDDVTHALGFRQFAMGHHVDLTGPPEDAIRLTTYDPQWIEQSLGERYFIDDPVHLASTRTATGFLWSDVGKLIGMNARHHRILEAADDRGLRHGFTVPVHVPGEYRGTCSFGAETLERLIPNALHLAQMMGSFAFEAARRIMRKRSSHAIDSLRVPQLTQRQRDAIALIGRGKGDWEISRIMGISPSTAHEHVENARLAYGGAPRPNLVVRALFDGQISFSEILRP